MWRIPAGFAMLCAALLAADDEPAARKKEQLARLQPLVGSWRGVGQPQRGSTKDSWIEEAQWAWSFQADAPALTASVSRGRYFRQLRLKAAAQAGDFTLVATPVVGAADANYSGRLDEQGQLVLLAEKPREGLPQRISLRFVASGDRLLVLLEKAGSAAGQYVRLAEIGYTRQGSGFGQLAQNRECVVTGGQGTIEVAHNGKTYHVCCTGCRDYFNDNPEKVLAEFAARQAANK